MPFEETILLQLKRKYSKDEEISFILDEMKKIAFRNGELISENAELTDKIKSLTAELDRIKKSPKIKLTKEDMLEERWAGLNKGLETMGKTNKRLQGDVDFWRSKYLDLSHKTK